jgi:hypothetical protein
VLCHSNNRCFDRRRQFLVEIQPGKFPHSTPAAGTKLQ